MKNPKTFLLLGMILMAAGVAVGAFGAHALKSKLVESGRTDTFETGIRYMLIHSLALILIGVLMDRYPQLSTAGVLLLIGIFFFSGSLLTLSLTNATYWGAVAPIGGTAFIVGWLYAAWTIYSNQ